MKMTYFWLTSLSLITGSIILCDKILEKQQTASSCSVDSFNCSNGLCVDSSMACDGLADCSDGSDETQQLCTQLITTCPSYAFRCKYGACVDKSVKCNGKNDCVDGSDENIPECKKSGSACKNVDEYQCKSGQCIDETTTCDGIRDCHDGSDETLVLCKTIQCPKYAFKCKYGACVSKESKCDGIRQCADGSDEDQCNTSTAKPTVINPSVTKPTVIKPTSTTSPNKPTTQFNKKTCIVPTSEGSIYSYNHSNQITVLPSGTVVDQYLIVEENCEIGYHKLVPYRFMICTATGQWEPLVSDKLCLRRCPPMKSDSLDIKCILNGEYADCSNPSIPGTKLMPSCKITHSLPNGQVETPIELICLPDGKWSGQLYKCVPYCGRLFIPNQVLISNGAKAKYGTAPWNVGIYRINNNNTAYDMICGGTLLAQNLVISAAHCFWKEGSTDRILMNNGAYKIAVGKYNRDIVIKDNDFTQIMDVGFIYLNDDFYGSSGFYAGDLAVIVLPTKVMISNVVLPICIDWSKQYTVPNGSLGKIVGWGNTENMVQSSTLLEATLPYIDHNTCRNMYKNGFQLFVTSDKFCAGSQLGQGVHEGDSGAGLTHVHSNLHYLTGVVSVKDPNTNNSVAVFTDVNHHIQWIRDIYVNYTYIGENTSRSFGIKGQ